MRYFHGNDVSKNLPLARYWLKKASTDSYAQRDNTDELTSTLTIIEGELTLERVMQADQKEEELIAQAEKEAQEITAQMNYDIMVRNLYSEFSNRIPSECMNATQREAVLEPFKNDFIQPVLIDCSGISSSEQEEGDSY